MPMFDAGNYQHALTTPQREYVSSDVDESSAVTRYYGFLAYNGYWLIRRINMTTGAMTYAAGKSGYDGAWTGRADLTYVRYNGLFQ